VTTYTAKTRFKDGMIRFDFPSPLDNRSINFKHDLVRRFKNDGKEVIYIGDGVGDYAAAKEADVSFAVEGSRLENLCRTNHDKCLSIDDFRQVTNCLEAESAP